MAVDKGLVRSALDIAFKGKSLSKTSKDKLAEAWAPIIDNNADIDGYIKEQTPALEVMIAQTDFQVTEALKKAPKTEPAKVETTTDEIEIPADASPEMKAMMSMMQGMKKKIDGFEASQSQQTVEQQFKNHEGLKGIPEIFFEGKAPKTAEEIDAVVEKIKTDVEAYQTANNITIIGKDTPPGAGGGAGGGTPAAESTEVAPELKAYFEKQNATTKN